MNVSAYIHGGYMRIHWMWVHTYKGVIRAHIECKCIHTWGLYTHILNLSAYVHGGYICTHWICVHTYMGIIYAHIESISIYTCGLYTHTFNLCTYNSRLKKLFFKFKIVKIVYILSLSFFLTLKHKHTNLQTHFLTNTYIYKYLQIIFISRVNSSKLSVFRRENFRIIS